jgi:glyoxylase-like metal-dependent hydrolase (beta-lactamase superfamily II)
LAIHRIHKDLFLVDLDLPIAGFTQFIGSWILQSGNRAVVIDPGPAATINTLRNSIGEIGIEGVDYVLLTHIHLDHAGGCGDLMQSYPDAFIVCHPGAVTHLADPERLWHGSLKVLGDLAKAYGQPSPVNKERICPETDIVWNGSAIHSLETPGHAYHHLCFFLENIVFAGEVAGVNLPLDGRLYMRPATPPPFRPNIALHSISLVAEKSPQLICYGHYGLREDAPDMLQRGHDQIRFWLGLIEGRRDRGLSLDEAEVFEELLAKDLHLNSYSRLEPDIRNREFYFCKNAIKGMVGFIST